MPLQEEDQNAHCAESQSDLLKQKKVCPIYVYIYSISYIKGPIYTGCPENFYPISVAAMEELFCPLFHSWCTYIGRLQTYSLGSYFGQSDKWLHIYGT